MPCLNCYPCVPKSSIKLLIVLVLWSAFHVITLIMFSKRIMMMIHSWPKEGICLPWSIKWGLKQKGHDQRKPLSTTSVGVPPLDDCNLIFGTRSSC